VGPDVLIRVLLVLIPTLTLIGVLVGAAVTRSVRAELDGGRSAPASRRQLLQTLAPVFAVVALTFVVLPAEAASVHLARAASVSSQELSFAPHPFSAEPATEDPTGQSFARSRGLECTLTGLRYEAHPSVFGLGYSRVEQWSCPVLTRVLIEGWRLLFLLPLAWLVRPVRSRLAIVVGTFTGLAGLGLGVPVILAETFTFDDQALTSPYWPFGITALGWYLAATMAISAARPREAKHWVGLTLFALGGSAFLAASPVIFGVIGPAAVLGWVLVMLGAGLGFRTAVSGLNPLAPR